jgi:hypothetical protein
VIVTVFWHGWIVRRKRRRERKDQLEKEERSTS